MKGIERLKHDEVYKQLVELALKDPKYIEKVARKEKCARPGGLVQFVELMWPFVEPSRKFIRSWHIDAICEHLEAVTSGEITQLLINIPPGFAKATSVDTIVLTRRGRIPLGNIVVGDEVLTHTGRFCVVEGVHEQGPLSTLLITTISGRQIRAEHTHPFLVPTGWLSAQDLAVGDTLAAITPIDEPGQDQVTFEEARLLGYLVGDGSVTHSPKLTNMEEDVLEDFERCASSLGLETSRRTKSPGKITKATDIGLRKSRRWLEKHNLLGKDSYTKRIPNSVLASGREAIAHFLGAYWSCDGTFTVRHTGKRGSIYVASCTTVGVDLASDIHHALLRVGISARIRKKIANIVTKKQPGGKYVSYDILSCSHEEVAKFANLPGLCVRKRKEVSGLRLQKFQSYLIDDQIASIEDGGIVECRCLTVADDHSFTANDIAVHNSLLSNVFFPAWEWGPKNLPSMRYIAASYSQDLTIRDNVRFRQIITGDLYQELWGDRVQPSKIQFSLENVGNTKTGWKIATSVGGIGTGARGDRIIIDDPNSVKDVESDKIRDSANQWFTEVVPTRKNDPSNSAIIVIQQRTHEEDVSGTILTKELGYEHLLIPMRYDGRRYYTSIGWTDPRGIDASGNDIENDGALAWPELYPEAVVEDLEKTLGPYAAAGQLQQSPVPRGGAIFERDWWVPWPIGADNKIRFPSFDYIVASVDTAFTEKQENDFSALTVWGMFRDTGESMLVRSHIDDPNEMMRVARDERPKVMLMYGWQKRLSLHGPPEERPFNISIEEWNSPWWRTERQKSWGLVEWVVDTCQRYHADTLLIETQAAGLSLEQELRRLHSAGDWGVQMIRAQKDKVARAVAVQHVFSNGLVHCPMYESGETPTWATQVIDQFSSFPKTRYKDIVDSGTHAIQHLRDTGLLVRKEEHDQSYEDQMRYRAQSRPLYPV